MPSGNCVIYKNSPCRPRVANAAFKSMSGKQGRRLSEDGLGADRQYRRGVWHRKGLASQTVGCDKTIQHGMKVIQLYLLPAYLTKADQIIAYESNLNPN